jgi:hypothetical protein
MFQDEGRDLFGERVTSIAQVGAARELARTLTVGFGICDEEGFPLSERQMIALLTAALLGFDELRVETHEALTTDRALSEALGAHRDRPSPRNPRPPAGSARTNGTAASGIAA